MDNLTMAPKTRHLAQGKRKRQHRSPPERAAQQQIRNPHPEAVVAPDLPGPAATVELAAPPDASDRSPDVQLPIQEAPPRRSPTGRTTRPYQARNGARATANPDAERAKVLPRDIEYAFIRSDMRRLLFTAGSLTVIMIVLLFLIDR